MNSNKNSKSTAVDKPLSAEALHRALTRPDKVSGIRLPSYPELAATCTTQMVGDGDFQATGQATDNGSYGILLRDPMYPLWWSTPAGFNTGVTAHTAVAKASYTSSYRFDAAAESNALMMLNYSGTVDMLFNAIGGPQNSSVTNVPIIVGTGYFPYASAALAQGVRPAPPLAYFGDISNNDLPWTWVPANSTVTYSVWVAAGEVNALPLTQCHLVLEEVISAEREALLELTGFTFSQNSAQLNVTPIGNRWIRPKAVTVANNLLGFIPPAAVYCAITVSNCGAPTITHTTVGRGPILTYNDVVSNVPLLLPVGFATGASALGFTTRCMNAAMMTGVRLQMENTTKVVNREGSILLGATDSSMRDFFKVSSQTEALSTIAALPAERRFRCASEHGVSATVLPGRQLQTLRNQVYNVSDVITTAATAGVMSLRLGDYATIIAFLDPDADTVSSFATRVDWTWEYITNTQFVQARVSGSDVSSLQQAVRRAITSPIFSTFEAGRVLAVTDKAPKPFTKRPPPKKGKKAEQRPKKPKARAPPKGWHPPMALK